MEHEGKVETIKRSYRNLMEHEGKVETIKRSYRNLMEQKGEVGTIKRSYSDLIEFPDLTDGTGWQNWNNYYCNYTSRLA